jgi:hypothetical protein
MSCVALSPHPRRRRTRACGLHGRAPALPGYPRKRKPRQDNKEGEEEEEEEEEEAAPPA